MSHPDLESLRARLLGLNDTYGARFAGHSRATRNLEVIDSMIADARSIAATVEGIDAPDAADKDLQTVARATLKLLVDERAKIAGAKTGGRDVEDFAQLGGQANAVFARYKRHFAGKARPTRDLGLLAEMIEDLTKIQNRMKSILDRRPDTSMQSDLDLVAQNLKVYVSERTAIADARGSGSLEQQADIYAEIANAQFQLYQEHFAGKSRLTRRPQLLQRIIETLRSSKERMLGLKKSGLKSDANTRNVDIVDQNLQMYINELAEVRKARAAQKLVDLQLQLGGAANETMELYRQNFAGKPRQGRDADLLSSICDNLGEIARQMQELGRAESNESNSRNLSIVADNLTMLDREWDQIVDANKVTV